ncbi:hypothetical protein GW796_10840 [archaeon]|nr:hypothetical protein [archaeon]NCQ52356.1 hypothetical protein [archaeon]
MMYQNIHQHNVELENQSIVTCQLLVKSANRDINSPSYQTKESLNTLSGLNAANSQDLKKMNLSSLSPEKVNCNIAKVRNSFIKNVNKVNNDSMKVTYSSSPG